MTIPRLQIGGPIFCIGAEILNSADSSTAVACVGYPRPTEPPTRFGPERLRPVPNKVSAYQSRAGWPFGHSHYLRATVLLRGYTHPSSDPLKAYQQREYVRL